MEHSEARAPSSTKSKSGTRKVLHAGHVQMQESPSISATVPHATSRFQPRTPPRNLVELG